MRNQEKWHVQKNMTEKISFILILLLSFSLTFSVNPAKAKGYGKLVKNTTIDKEYRTGNTPEGYTYYYYGWKGKPDAIIGVKDGYTLNSKRWKPLDKEETSVRTLILQMYKRESTNFYGAWIMDPGGNKMGTWYSDSGGAKIKMAGNTEIDFIAPELMKGNDRRCNR